MKHEATSDIRHVSPGALVLRHLGGSSSETAKQPQFGPRLGEMSRSTSDWDPVKQALQRRGGRSIRWDSLGAMVAGATRAQRADMQAVRSVGCLVQQSSAREPSQSSSSRKLDPVVRSTGTAFYKPSSELPATAKMSRTFVHFASNLPVHTPEPKELHFAPGRVRKLHDGPINWVSNDAAFWPTVQGANLVKEGVPSVALQRSMNLMGNLYDLRRLKCAEQADDGALALSKLAEKEDVEAGRSKSAEKKPPKAGMRSKSAEKQPPTAASYDEDEAMGMDAGESILFSVLSDLNDAEASLRFVEKTLAENRDAAAQNGGARHPSTLQCSRSLAVVRRKAELLHDVEERTADFVFLDKQREDILTKLLKDTGSIPHGLKDLDVFVDHYTHKGGNPVDANRMNFQSFVTHFKLPSQHSALLAMTELGEEAGEWWAQKCLDHAQKSATYEQLRRLLDAAEECGADKENFKMVTAIKLVRDRLATDVLEKAQKRASNDKMQQDRSKGNMPPGAATKASDEIEKEIVKAMNQGVPLSDKRLVDAKALAAQLREADGLRKRMANRQAKLEGKGT